jgi:hypothetical protein
MDTAGMVLAFFAVTGGLAIGPFAIWFGGRQQQRKREMEHIERMKALEFGRTLPQDEPWSSPARIGALIGVVVPLGVFLSVAIATSAAGFHEGMWIAAGMVGMASVIAGATLAGQSIHHQKTSDRTAIVKPYVEDDAYDVVSSRG